jgi:putative nucleotidyltransferase with HDIG domain
MKYRVKQFFQALFAKVTQEDRAFISQYLTKQQQTLFFRLRPSEQYHSLKVAYACKDKMPYDTLLVKAALLHDIGKLGTNLHLINKVFVVLAMKCKLNHNLLPLFLQKAIQAKMEHPKRGYDLLLGYDAEKSVLEIIKNHHQEEKTTEAMRILQYYDNLY